MNRITLALENDFEGKVIASFDLEEYAEQIRGEVITEVFKGIYEHFEKHHIEVFGKDEILDELILFLDEYYVYTKIKEQLKEQIND